MTLERSSKMFVGFTLLLIYTVVLEPRWLTSFSITAAHRFEATAAAKRSVRPSPPWNAETEKNETKINTKVWILRSGLRLTSKLPSVLLSLGTTVASML